MADDGAQAGASRKAREYLKDYFSMLTEMKELGLIRTRNAPLGDLAEHVVLAAYGGRLSSNQSEKSFDLVDGDNRKIQVKACTASARGQFSAFRSFDFDLAVFVVVDPVDGELREAWEAGPHEVEEACNRSGHTNAWMITVTKVRKIGTDVTEKIRDAYTNA